MRRANVKAYRAFGLVIKNPSSWIKETRYRSSFLERYDYSMTIYKAASTWRTPSRVRFHNGAMVFEEATGAASSIFEE